jgi:hypothetical protein
MTQVHGKESIHTSIDLPEGQIIKMSDGRYRIVGKRTGPMLALHVPRWYQQFWWELKDVLRALFGLEE